MMERFTLVITLIANLAFSQDPDYSKTNYNSTWEIQKQSMVLNIEFKRDSQRDSEELQFTVNRAENADRPNSISIVLPNEAIDDQGITFAFHSVERKYMELSKATNQICDSDCSFVFENASFYYTKKDKTIDVFERMKSYDYLYLTWKDENNSFVRTEISLKNFSEYYNSLN